MTTTQTAQIRAALERGESITPLDALKRWNCFRLGARCWDLRKDGFDVETIMITLPSGKRIASYRMASGQRSLFA